ncbi:MAG: transglycosylase SLT domain-containing protein [Desulfobacterales bacterium]
MKSHPPHSSESTSIHVRVERGNGTPAEKTYQESFRIGRGSDCQIQFSEAAVSRRHVEVLFIGGKWWIQDLGSGNGTLVNGNPIHKIPLESSISIELGRAGPLLTLTPKEAMKKKPPHEDPLSLTQYKKHYFSDSDEGNIGQHTMMVRRAFAKVQKKQKRKYGSIIALVTCLCLIAGGIAVYNHLQIQKQKALAADIFYNMKSLELQLAEVRRAAKEKKDEETLAKLNQYRDQQKQLEINYNRYIDSLKIYKKKMPMEERLILQMARTFGECEINIPDEFAQEVMKYIEKWKSTQRFQRAVNRAREEGFIPIIAETLTANDLPPHFFYLAMQESNFNIEACGPKTRWGIAKGMWQFIPDTAKRYGLKIGPLADQRKPDPKDDRHNPQKATQAAALYLRDIYETDAQASGLLVMASYNWGENRVIKLIRKIKADPRERNFWNLLINYRDKIPKETYDYVFYIFSAAVIGQNPQLFGFELDNPLAVTMMESPAMGG